MVRGVPFGLGGLDARRQVVDDSDVRRAVSEFAAEIVGDKDGTGVRFVIVIGIEDFADARDACAECARLARWDRVGAEINGGTDIDVLRIVFDEIHRMTINGGGDVGGAVILVGETEIDHIQRIAGIMEDDLVFDGQRAVCLPIEVDLFAWDAERIGLSKGDSKRDQ